MQGACWLKQVRLLRACKKRISKKAADALTRTSSLPSREGDNVCRIRCPGVLGDVDLRVGDAVNGGVVPVPTMPSRQDATVVGATEARHARHDQAKQDLLLATGQSLAKAAIIDVFGVARKVSPWAPESSTPSATHEGLEAASGVRDDLLDGAGAVERPLRVQAGQKLQALVLSASLEQLEIRLRIAFQLQAVLDALDFRNGQVLPHTRVHVRVGPRHRRLGTEYGLHLSILFRARCDLEKNVFVHAILVGRLPKLGQVARRVTQPLLRLATLDCDHAIPGLHKVELRVAPGHHRVQQPRQTIVLQDRCHVVPIALPRVGAAVKQTAVRRVVEHAAVTCARPDERLEVLTFVLVVFVI
mmetsp:Transcript_42366/g.106795  ORF Transcript_42366/g.106795 Transcript_42366/m.106795 type:complete len:358 (+) Transcript_42366:215-1288(+)